MYGGGGSCVPGEVEEGMIDSFIVLDAESAEVMPNGLPNM